MTNEIPKGCSGSTYFFTARLTDRSGTLLVNEIDHLRDATRRTMSRYPFRIDAIAVLPSTIHTLWTLPPDDDDVSVRWSMLKSLFSRGLPSPAYRAPGQIRRGDKGIWQRRFWQHLIGDADDYAAHLAMIHSSPVQAGLCTNPHRWPHSSIHRETQPPRPQVAQDRVAASLIKPDPALMSGGGGLSFRQFSAPAAARRPATPAQHRRSVETAGATPDRSPHPIPDATAPQG
jgi:putative transposase